jgi:hypothetical protein
MKIKLIPLLLVLILFVTCKKDNTGTTANASDLNNISDPVDTLIPLNDLGRGTYHGYVGGLYPNGANTPSGPYAKNLHAMSKSIIPIDTFGNPSNIGKQGQILFISMGASTGANTMMALKEKTVGNPLTNPKLHLMNCNQAAQQAPLNFIMNPKSDYWGHVGFVLKYNKGSFRQVQVVYLETEDSTRSLAFPGRPVTVKDDLEACLRVMKSKFPNLKVVYVLGRSRVFGTNAAWNREPAPYYFGWACKWAIEDQINKVHGTRYWGPSPVAPMITWGFYEWATTKPRTTDGFSWQPSETKDGLHGNEAGQDTVATRFQNFLLTDRYASLWYAAH